MRCHSWMITQVFVVYFLKQKSDTVEATQKFIADTLPFGKVIGSDNGTEFMRANISKLYCARMQSNMKLARRIPHTKMGP